jgi:hypothetical protein
MRCPLIATRRHQNSIDQPPSALCRGPRPPRTEFHLPLSLPFPFQSFNLSGFRTVRISDITSHIVRSSDTPRNLLHGLRMHLSGTRTDAPNAFTAERPNIGQISISHQQRRHHQRHPPEHAAAKGGGPVPARRQPAPRKTGDGPPFPGPAKNRGRAPVSRPPRKTGDGCPCFQAPTANGPRFQRPHRENRGRGPVSTAKTGDGPLFPANTGDGPCFQSLPAPHRENRGRLFQAPAHRENRGRSRFPGPAPRKPRKPGGSCFWPGPRKNRGRAPVSLVPGSFRPPRKPGTKPGRGPGFRPPPPAKTGDGPPVSRLPATTAKTGDAVSRLPATTAKPGTGPGFRPWP